MDHGEAGAFAATVVHPTRSMFGRREDRLTGIHGPQMQPVVGREIVGDKYGVAIFGEASTQSLNSTEPV